MSEFYFIIFFKNVFNSTALNITVNGSKNTKGHTLIIYFVFIFFLKVAVGKLLRYTRNKTLLDVP